MEDVFKILKDLEYKAVGIDPNTKKMPEGYFVSFRPVGLPIPPDDFANPWTPMGSEMKQINSDVAKTVAAASNDAAGTKPSSIDINLLLTAGIADSMMSYINTFVLTDEKLAMNELYSVMPDASHVSDAWFAVITGANGTASDIQLSDQIKKSVSDAQALIMDKDSNPTPHYSAYQQYRHLHEDKVKALNKAFAAAISDPGKFARWPIDGKPYQDDVDDAWDQWQGFGFKNEIEQAIDLLAAQGMDPAIALIARAKNKYANSIVHFDKIGDFPYTWIIPNKWYDIEEDDGWTDYSQDDFHSEVHIDDSSSTISGHAGLNTGFWSASASVDDSSSRQDLNLKTTNLTVSFEYCSADIQRPWLDTTLLRLGNWFLIGAGASAISDGTYGQELKTTTLEATFLPSITTSFILVRNLTIKWDEMNEHQSTLQNASSSTSSIGWGLFSGKIKSSHKNKNEDFSLDFDTEGLHIRGVQLIGYVSAITPASPRLDSKDYVVKKSDPASAKTNGQPVQPTTTTTNPQPVAAGGN